MNYKKLVGLGALIWAIVYIAAMGLFAYKLLDTIQGKVILMAVAALATFIAAKNLNAQSAKETLKYSAGWVLIGVILDLIFTVPFTGLNVFYEWTLWLGYALILLVPVLAIRRR